MPSQTPALGATRTDTEEEAAFGVGWDMTIHVF
uniref:Uncharacterized protein n=1 Tax=Arundo donax TaxID=35708 RepID=A0A0A9ECF3_ARUDO